jgi:hypothetical protein
LKAEFDSTYPIHLNGIISQEEFRDSIQRINRSISLSIAFLVLAIVFGLSMIGGVICFIVGGVTAANSYSFGFPALIGVGIAITTIGSIIFSVGCCTVQLRRASRMRQAIAAESMKYSSRSPTPCSWRLDTTRHCVGGYGNSYNNQILYHVSVITL